MPTRCDSLGSLVWVDSTIPQAVSLATQYRKEQNEFLSHIITCDETRVHHYTPECKQSSMQWNHVSLSSPRNSRCSHLQERLWLVFFWDTQGVVLVDFVPPGHTVNVECYCTLLSDCLWPAVCRKQPVLLKKGVILQHDNASPHKAHQTIEKTEEMARELVAAHPGCPGQGP